MDAWYSRNFGDPMLTDATLDGLGACFHHVFARAGEPPEMAVFTRLESEGRLHCKMIAYFSPAAQDVADTFGAEPCERPARAGLGLFAGDERAWSVLFREWER
jgi:hypothetical protein